MVQKVILESPFSNKDKNKFINNYYYMCVVARKMMVSDEIAPLFFHALYTQFLNDNIKEERDLGLYRSFHYHSDADNKTYAIDRGISHGMILGAEDAINKNMEIKFYTVLPSNTDIAQHIDEINNIIDLKERWTEGSSYVTNLMNNADYKNSYDETGDLTLYSSYIKDDLEMVKNCITDFFKPLISMN